MHILTWKTRISEERLKETRGRTYCGDDRLRNQSREHGRGEVDGDAAS